MDRMSRNVLIIENTAERLRITEGLQTNAPCLSGDVFPHRVSGLPSFPGPSACQYADWKLVATDDTNCCGCV